MLKLNHTERFLNMIPLKYRYSITLRRFMWDAFWFATFPFYAGNKYLCPICGGKFRKLLTEHHRCPRCGSFSRHRMLYLFLAQKTNFFSHKPKKILHIGPEICLQKAVSNVPSVFYTSGDVRDGAAMVKLDVTDMDCEDQAFDIVICSHVLEHVSNDKKAMSELFRVLNPEGYAIIQVPLSSAEETYEDPSIQTPEEREVLFGYHDHVRLYGKKDFVKRLEGVGFNVREYNSLELFDMNTLVSCALDQTEELFICFRSISKAPTP